MSSPRPVRVASVTWHWSCDRSAVLHGVTALRVFVALNLAAATRAAIHAAAEPLRLVAGRAVSWTREPALHVTLKFLGDVSDELVARLVRDLGPAVATVPPLVLDVGGVGGFPSLARPRVLWIGVAPNSPLPLLYQRVDAACAVLGLPRESRPFHPHLTIGRVRPGTPLDARLVAREAEQVRLRIQEPVSTVDIMESVLGPGGAQYRILEAIPVVGQIGEV